jgi:D-lactate dehydrogenase
MNADKSILKDYNFNTELTCAVDGMCETTCPININTGEFVKDLRKEKVGKVGLFISNWIVDHFKLVNHSLEFAVKIMSLKTKLFGKKIVRSTFNFINNASMHRIPAWNTMISGSTKSPKQSKFGSGAKYIYYPSCISRTFSADIKKNSIISIMGNIAEKCNVNLIIPDNIEDTCCSTPFSSKGYERSGIKMFEKTIELLYKVSNSGDIPVVVDTSPCTYKFLYPSENISQKTKDMWNAITFIDIIPFLEEITNTKNYKPINKKIILHPTCSTHKMEHVQTMKILAQRCARKVIIPENSSCCGFAGDRGMIVPELTINAVELNKSSLSKGERKINGYSSSRMCEFGVSDEDQVYESIVVLVHEYLKSS